MFPEPPDTFRGYIDQFPGLLLMEILKSFPRLVHFPQEWSRKQSNMPRKCLRSPRKHVIGFITGIHFKVTVHPNMPHLTLARRASDRTSPGRYLQFTLDSLQCYVLYSLYIIDYFPVVFGWLKTYFEVLQKS